MSLDNLRLFPWVVAAVFALAAGLWRPRKLHSTAVGAVLLFAALNAAAGIYVLNHFGDPRWSAGGTQRLTAPSLEGTPVVGQFLQPLDAALNGVVGGVNDFLAFKEALPVALDFLGASGWALLLAFPLAVLAAVINYVAAKRRAAAFAKYRATVDQLQVELDQVKRQLSLLGPAHAGSGVEAPAGRTGLAP
ncbi:hypothetical protein [Arthrobacter sp. Soil763]|uniref:hypothetical protein n=1 Tax=Arthrobacter sp. Soil763 TaxID=1736402 RepID=UPI0006FD20B5|nr:hypothetical protein [Arthrobacter sp. Soil763]KRE79318.1 hypothetical protein ASG71_04285 [Arthrobacter sp. Soil763]